MINLHLQLYSQVINIFFSLDVQSSDVSVIVSCEACPSVGSFSDGQLVRVRGILTRKAAAALVTVSSEDAGSNIAVCTKAMTENGAELRIEGYKPVWGASIEHHTLKVFEVGAGHRLGHDIAKIRTSAISDFQCGEPR
jgi:hypothetical protein